MVIAGILVVAKDGNAEQTKDSLETIEGVEVHYIEDGCKLITTVETRTYDENYELVKRLTKLDGIIGVYPVYVNFEGDDTMIAPYIPPEGDESIN
ncbi:chaperone NapD [Microaerobacter geothermalis]|uniref:chaperone NapD n=1 Tax=Microaerobacter geothermalis TaxID=674972 RepID=UPI001F2E435B|nr:chaperone NapD [Microaerobacter geothermalis]MCF6095233.1 chaperone NapD [Microaerobacter geothermalis]